MKRVIDGLNEMSFELPKGWVLSKDVYTLPNGQGMINKENYVSEQGEVISLFEVHRDPEDFFEYYENLLRGFPKYTQKYEVAMQEQMELEGFVMPVYIIRGYGEQKFLMAQVFVDCGDCLACFMIYLSKLGKDLQDTIDSNHVFGQLIDLLRTVE